MANRLANETSPYLRQHADNPVDWYAWGPEAFAAARQRDRPILLSVGYSSCHWCHVMAHESFEDHETAAEMNDLFVNVKVDREERPDVDAIYMEATQAMTGRGGWPMTVFMTPEGEPFYCGTYFPSDPARGTPTFRQLIAAIDDVWKNRRNDLMEQASQLVEVVGRQTLGSGPGDLPGQDVLRDATEKLLSAHDARFGGFGSAPKFPQTMSLDHLLRHHLHTGSPAALEAVTTSLDAMAAGGIHDHIGGGFSRYSVDDRWLVPHFEKMLYDNALLARVYLHAWQVTGEDRFLRTCTDTIEYVLADLSHPAGGRYSAEDADSAVSYEDSHHEEGAFYVWTPEMVARALTEAGLSESIDETLEWFGITVGGNFEGASIPNILHHQSLTPPPDQVEAARIALRKSRSGRPRPGLDDKVLTEWNALMMGTLAEAAAATGRNDWLHAAIATGEFLCKHLLDESPHAFTQRRWLRSWQAAEGASDASGKAHHLAYASDYAALLDGFITLYEASGQLRWLDRAVEAADDMLRLFWDTEGTLWSTGEDAEALIARPKDLMDNATPSANSTAAVALLRLEAHTGESPYGEHARSILRNLGEVARTHPASFGNLLRAVDLHVNGITEIVITGVRPDLVEAAQTVFLPNSVLAWGEPGSGPLWEGRSADPEVPDSGLAYLCTRNVCAAPISDASHLATALSAGASSDL